MTLDVRFFLEEKEMENLSERAAKSALSRGREIEIEPCPLRTAFQQDRDRILHCKSFRRLKHKTQVFLAPSGDHFRTRLTHTLEVSQIARTIARALRLNEDLTEAIALGHDLGHTPFGHIGERTLCDLSPIGFTHNQQSLRIVTHLENGEGLNLTWEVRDGILCHSGDDVPHTLEGCVVRVSDRIAYINHDIDDALRAGKLKQEDLPKDCTNVLGDTHSQRLDTMIMDVVMQSMTKAVIEMSEPVQKATDDLRAFLFEEVYFGTWAEEETRKADHVLRLLYHYLMENTDFLPQELQGVAHKEGKVRAVCDHIAGMTDNYAMKRHNEWFVPASFWM